MVSILFCEGEPCPAVKLENIFYVMLDNKYYRMSADGTFKRLKIVPHSLKESFNEA